VVGQIWATLALMKESDEFVRALTAKQFILAAGAAMAIASVWGFGESYADAYHLPAWIIYPLFWACFGVIAPFVRSSR
jgi:putative oxidoreductase